jgi:hypothetical protein
MKKINVRFEVFTAVTMKKAVFWDVHFSKFCPFPWEDNMD